MHKTLTRSLSIGLLSMACTAAAWATTQTVSVADPDATSWETQLLMDGGPPSAVSATVAGSGDTEWQVHWTLGRTTAPGSWTNVLALVYTGAAYDPGTQGAVEQLDVAIDLLGLSSSFSSGATGFVRPLLRQDGVVFTVAGSDAQVGPVMATPSRWSFSATDNWVSLTPGAVLDLSAGGSPIEFGARWALGANCSGASGCNPGSAVTALDNFQWTVTAAVPEPGSWALMLAGLAAVGVMKRRR